MDSFNERRTFCVALLWLGVAGCAHSNRAEDSAQMARVDLLEEQVERQVEEIEKILARVEVMSTRLAELNKKSLETAKTQVAVSIPSEIPIERLTPPPEENAEMSEDILADSFSESMHLYYQGIAFKNEGKFEEALKEFSKFIKQEPAHIYADRAQFQIIDCYFLNKEFSLVLSESQRFENLFPYSVRRESVAYLRGLSYASLGRRDEGRRYLNHIVKKRRNGKLAKEALNKMREWDKPEPPKLLSEAKPF